MWPGCNSALTLWASVAVFIKMIPAGIITAKTATDTHKGFKSWPKNNLVLIEYTHKSINIIYKLQWEQGRLLTHSRRATSGYVALAKLFLSCDSCAHYNTQINIQNERYQQTNPKINLLEKYGPNLKLKLSMVDHRVNKSTACVACILLLGN